MPQNRFQKMMFAFITVVITVHAYVFYSLYVVNGQTLMSVTGQSSVLGAINAQGGVYMLGRMCPIWLVVIVEFVLANWLKLVCFNFPFAFFTQLFFIQPLVRTVFKAIFVRKKAVTTEQA